MEIEGQQNNTFHNPRQRNLIIYVTTDKTFVIRPDQLYVSCNIL